MLLSVTAMVNAGWVSRLLHKDPKDNMNSANLQEYYGRIQWPDNEAYSTAYLTMLVSYEYATHTIRFHFNMKEPARKDSKELAETDF